MFKAYHKIVLILLVFASGNASAQVAEWFNREGNNILVTDWNLTGDGNQDHWKNTDSIKLKVTDVKDIQLIIDNKLGAKIFGVEIDNSKQPDLLKIVMTMASLPNLRYLKIADAPFGSLDALPYRLPEKISILQQLTDIELACTDKIDMADALAKLSTLKQLQTLAFTEYPHKVPANLVNLKQLNRVMLGTQNTGKIDLSKAGWQQVDITGADVRKPSALDPFKDGPVYVALLNVSKIKPLKKLSLKLKTLPDAAILSKFKQIKELRISGTLKATDTLFTQIDKLTGIEHLAVDLPLNQQIDIDALKDLAALKSLSLTFQSETKKELRSIATINRFKNLESLSIKGGNLGQLTDIFEQMPRLKTVLLTDDHITGVPDHLFDLPALENLDLSRNDLKDLPAPEKYLCDSLKTISLKHNHIAELPSAIVNLSHLENFDVSENLLRMVPPGWEKMQKLKSADFTFNQLQQFPGGLQDNHNVEKINISKNAIQVIPEPTGTNYKLNWLIIGMNPITYLPQHLDSYNRLEYLDAGYLTLKSLPNSLADIRTLKSLSLSQSIKAPTILPPGLKNLTGLTYFNLDFSPLLDKQGVFDFIFNTQSPAVALSLSWCDISELPASKAWSKVKLRSLGLAGNPLTTLPVEFADLDPSTTVWFSENKFDGISQPFPAGVSIQNKADMKFLLDQLNIIFPKSNEVSNADYAATLTKQIPRLYYGKKYSKVLEFAQRVKKIDSVYYLDNAPLDMIGYAKLQLKDYKGAISDLKQAFIYSQQKKATVTFYGYAMQEFIFEAYMNLHQPEEAAKFYAKIAVPEKFTKAMKVCWEIKKPGLFKSLLDTAIAEYNKPLPGYSKDRYNGQRAIFYPKNHYPPYYPLEAAFLQLLANKPNKALQWLARPALPNNSDAHYQPIKALLIAAANYLKNPKSIGTIKANLTSVIIPHYKIEYPGIVPFETWLPYSNFTAQQQADLMELEKIAR